MVQNNVFALPAGAVIGGRYKLLKSLGQGGFGITYRAWDGELNRSVVVKECFPAAICRRDIETGMIHPMHPGYENALYSALEDMRKEAKTLASLNHEGIVRIHDIIWGNGSVFCVMSWLSGGTLGSRMKEGIPANDSLHYLRCILDALAYLHANRVIHRDIKPDNIMFDESGRPVIIDFGAALNRADHTSTTTQGAFSPGYAAPEQVTGKGKIGPWTDFYALSAVWYELLTGIRPEAANARLMQDDIAPLSSACRVSYPAELLNLLQRNLSLKPAERCQSVAQWLECWKNGTLPPLPIPKPGGAMRRRLWVSAAVAAAVAAGVSGAYYLWPEPVVAPGRSASNSSPDALKKSLREKVSKAGRVNEFVAETEAACKQYQEMTARHKKELNDLIESTEAAFAKVTSAKELRALQKQFNASLKKRESAQDAEMREFMNNFHRAYASFDLDGPEAVASHYKPKDMEEASLLSLVAGELWNELVHPTYSKFIIMATNPDLFVNNKAIDLQVRMQERELSFE